MPGWVLAPLILLRMHRGVTWTSDSRSISKLLQQQVSTGCCSPGSTSYQESKFELGILGIDNGPKAGLACVDSLLNAPQMISLTLPGMYSVGLRPGEAA